MEDIFIKILNAIAIFISVILGTGIITEVLAVIIINVGEVCERVFKMREAIGIIIGSLFATLLVAIGVLFYLNLEISKNDYQKILDAKDTCLQKQECTKILEEMLIDNKISKYEELTFLYYVNYKEGIGYIINKLKQEDAKWKIF